mgnify:CR=1 FL=1
MASCERCWWRAHDRSEWAYDPSAAYCAELREAEDTQAICTLSTLEGVKARAGEYWDETTQADRRISTQARQTEGR